MDLSNSNFGYGLIVVLCRKPSGGSGNGVEFLTYTYTEVFKGETKFSWRFPAKTDNAGTTVHELADITVRGRVLNERCTGFRFVPLPGESLDAQSGVKQPIITMVKKGDSGGLHYQHVFLGALEEEVRLRDSVRESSEAGNTIKTVGVPEWREARELWGLMKANGQASHRIAEIAALNVLVGVDSQLAQIYSGLLESPLGPNPLTEGDEDISYRGAIQGILELNHGGITDLRRHARLARLF